MTSQQSKVANNPEASEVAHLEQLLKHLKPLRALSWRESQIVAAGAQGLHTKATAAALGLSPKTVDELWRRVYRKLGCSSRLEVLSRILARAERGGGESSGT